MNYDLADIVRLFDIDIAYVQLPGGQWRAVWARFINGDPKFWTVRVDAEGTGATQEDALRDLVRRLDEDNG